MSEEVMVEEKVAAQVNQEKSSLRTHWKEIALIGVISSVVFGAFYYPVYKRYENYQKIVQSSVKTLEGKVIEEHYIPKTGEGDSQYRFSLETLEGLAVVEVIDDNKESAERLIHVGRKMKFKVHNDYTGHSTNHYIALTDDIFDYTF